MREIKFRVYHKSSSRMLDWNEFITSYYLNDFMETEKYPRDSSYFKEHYEFWSPLMQFTGLYDKNGNGIYEGDIIEHDDDLEGNGVWKTYQGCEVKFDSENAMYSFENDDGTPLTHYRDLVVIGNIYDNPEYQTFKMQDSIPIRKELNKIKNINFTAVIKDGGYEKIQATHEQFAAIAMSIQEKGSEYLQLRDRSIVVVGILKVGKEVGERIILCSDHK